MSSVAEQKTQFSRVLQAREVVLLSFGAMIGWSWVLLTGFWLTEAGTLGTLIAFSIGGLAITLIGLTYSELASAMPKAGGEHVYTHRALGPSLSFVCTWALLFAYINVCLFESVALPTAVEYLFPGIRMGVLWNVLGADVDIGFVIVGALGTLVVTWANYVGIKTAAMVQSIVTGVIILAGILLITGAAVEGSPANAGPWLVTTGGVLVVLIMVPSMLVGFDVIPQSAEEINLPPKKIGTLLVISVFCAVLWYIAISAAVGFSLTPEQIAASGMPTADSARTVWGGQWAGTMLVLGGIGGIMTSWNAFIVGGSRVLYALARSGWVPAAFARIHPRYQTPYVGILAIGILSLFAPLFGRTILVWLVNSGSFAVTIAFLFVAVSFLVLRHKEPELERPFKVSHPNLVGYGAIILSLGLLSAFMPWSESALSWPAEWLTIVVWTTLGSLVYLFYRKTALAQDSVGSTPR